ncbi:flagellar basal body P-ring formation chaperone FlgA [Pseudoalteromonas luteoviolacea]|uniref:flagellar basal body P-ring formation chaperone FlgA n=1 Tax=Pseudoalteromonas luteoviolacea TaxID=43657 RepID=UPI001B3744D0|nr:flagellar basal body P-ring formation chaperone FlgA [Pseudoalteromonas luteoviolacea]MBQ4836330.1 flagellar basal body P-ring formation protein FlgA [Pseudoalteromonas luteoviolacea]
MSLLKNTIAVQFFLILAYFLAKQPVYAHTYEPEQIQEVAIKYVEKHTTADPKGEVNVSALPLDSRLPNRQCKLPLKVSSKASPPFNRQVTVQVRCNDKKNWVQFVHIKIETLYPVIVSTQQLDKGTVLQVGDLKMAMRPKHFVRASNIDSIDMLVGSKTKRRIQADKAINLRHVCMVCKGDSVIIVAGNGHFAIKTQGIALQDGNLGEQIRVKNVKSGKTIRARVKDVDSVAVNI